MKRATILLLLALAAPACLVAQKREDKAPFAWGEMGRNTACVIFAESIVRKGFNDEWGQLTVVETIHYKMDQQVILESQDNMAALMRRAQTDKVRFVKIPAKYADEELPKARAICQPPQPLTVAQMNQLLADTRGKSDSEAVADLANLVLTERVSSAQLARWQSALPGPGSRRAITALADSSAFLDPPAADRLTLPPPDEDRQSAILSAAGDSTFRNFGSVPDLAFTRIAQHFEGLAALQDYAGVNLGVVFPKAAFGPPSWTGLSTASITYRNGNEVQSAQPAETPATAQHFPGLMPVGAFGALVATVLRDAEAGSIGWAYWQRNGASKIAVFRYSVPDGQSNYSVSLNLGSGDVYLFPAYHGEIAIDPSTGAILRVTLIADPPHAQGIQQSAISAEYGSVSLGGNTYLCPVRSVTLLEGTVSAPTGRTRKNTPLQGFTAPGVTHAGISATQTLLNDLTFTSYHLFRADVRILAPQQ